MIKAIILDFDGTIADSVDIKTKAFAELYKPYGDNIVRKVVEYHLAHGGTSRYDKFRFFHKQFLKIDLREFEVKELSENFSKLVIDKVVGAPYIPGAFEFISNYYHIYDMYISTATPTDEIYEILNRKKLTQYFKGIKGSPGSKVDHVSQIITEKKYFLNEIIFIGDSDYDKKAAKRNKILFVAVLSGVAMDNEKYKVSNLNELKTIIDSFEK